MEGEAAVAVDRAIGLRGVPVVRGPDSEVQVRQAQTSTDRPWLYELQPVPSPQVQPQCTSFTHMVEPEPFAVSVAYDPTASAEVSASGARHSAVQCELPRGHSGDHRAQVAHERVLAWPNTAQVRADYELLVRNGTDPGAVAAVLRIQCHGWRSDGRRCTQLAEDSMFCALHREDHQRAMDREG